MDKDIEYSFKAKDIDDVITFLISLFEKTNEKVLDVFFYKTN